MKGKMGRKGLIEMAVIFLVAAAVMTMTVPAVGAQSASASRDIQTQTLMPGNSTLVSITVTNNETQSLILDEDIPANWTLTPVDNAGATFKPSEHKWLWSSAAFPAGETKTVVYNLTVPSDATAQDYYLSGVIKNSSGIIGNVAGETKITVTAPPVKASASASRDIQTQTLMPGNSTLVSITVTNNETQSLILDEDIPANWTLTPVDNAGATFKPSEHKWLWSSAAFPAGETKTVVYNLTVPSDATAQDYYLSGVIKNSSGIIGDVAGETKITVTITEIHDINVTWIKVLKDTTEIPEGDNLTIGETYKIRYRVNNDGNFDEPEVNITVKLANDTWETTLREHTASINAGSGGTYTITSWDTTGLTAGVYTITVNASIADDANPADNERTRDVTLETAPEQVPVSVANRYEPDIALSSAGNIYVAFEGYGEYDAGIGFSKSTDNGNSFTSEICAGDLNKLASDPAIAAYNGNVYVVWLNDEDYKIYYARSTDGGDSFETKVQVSDAGMCDGNPDIAVDSSGVIYVVWDGGDYIYIDKSTNGTAFGTDVIVNDSFNVVEKPSIAIDGDDNILVAWSGRMDGMTNHVYLAKSTDGGATFSAAVRVSAEDTEARYPSVVVDPTDSNKIYVAWVDYGEDAAGDIYVATSSDGGANFGTGVKVNDDTADAEQKFPCMAVNSTGAVFVVWQDGRNYESDYDIYFAGSTDGGNSFSANRKVNPDDTKAVTPTLAVDDTNAFVAWRNTDDQRIYFRKMPLVAPVTPVINGYKGKRYTGGADIKTVQNLTINGNVLYSVGDSYYMSGSTAAWETYTANWTASDLPVPAGATIVKARLYVYYTWDMVQGMPDNVSLTFNGNPKTRDAFYTDRKGFGSYDYPSGMLAYDVTADFDASGNTAVLENLNPVAGNPSIYGMLLVVIYEKTGETERTIWLNEECDILQARDDYNVSSTEATAFAPFAGTIDTDNVSAATLITVVPSGADGDDRNRLYFNTGEWHGIWDGFAGSTQLGINETDVTDYLSSTDNLAKLQSNIPTGETKGDYMVATNAILVVEEWTLWVYDLNGDKEISYDEAVDAVQDYFADKITKDQLIEVLKVYFE